MTIRKDQSESFSKVPAYLRCQKQWAGSPAGRSLQLKAVRYQNLFVVGTRAPTSMAATTVIPISRSILTICRFASWNMWGSKVTALKCVLDDIHAKYMTT